MLIFRSETWKKINMIQIAMKRWANSTMTIDNVLKLFESELTVGQNVTTRTLALINDAMIVNDHCNQVIEIIQRMETGMKIVKL